jgi:hypothetical protein
VPEHCKPGFLKWLEANVGMVSSAEIAAIKLDEDFDLDKAEGLQLDVLGDIVGRKRLLEFEPKDGSGSFLQDEHYRIVIRAKIGINHWNGSIPQMQDNWNNLFPDLRLVVIDNQDMSMDVHIVGRVSILFTELTEHWYIVPKPEGVRINLWFDLIYDEIEPLDLYIGAGSVDWRQYTVFPHRNYKYRGLKDIFVGAAIEDNRKYDTVTSHRDFLYPCTANPKYALVIETNLHWVYGKG